MGWFKKGPDRDALIKQGIADAEAAAAGGEKKDDDVHTGNEKIDIELTKIKAQLESFGEIRKANQERFSRIAEQTGELRGMIIDTNKAMSKIEVAATKAVDLVESVHPEKLMIEVRKQDGKIAGLRALIESNDSIMKDIMAEMKRMRSQMNFYKGTEQVLQMNEEVKKELADIKKMEAVVERHADRVETIFVEVEKKFSDFEKFDSVVKEVKETSRKLSSDFEKVRAQMIQKEDKKEFTDLLDKFNDFEKHTTNLLKLLDERSKITKAELDAQFIGLKGDLIKDIKSAKVAKPELVKEVLKDAPKEEPVLEENVSKNSAEVTSADVKEKEVDLSHSGSLSDSESVKEEGSSSSSQETANTKSDPRLAGFDGSSPPSSASKKKLFGFFKKEK